MHLIKDIFAYPFRGGGKYILIIGVIMTLINYFASYAGILGFITGALFFGYFSAIYFQIIESTAVGEQEAPEFPEISNILEDIISPALKVIGVILVCLIPWIIALITQKDFNIITHLALAAGIIYFPMAILAVSVLGHFTALSPTTVIPAIFRAGWIYWLCVAILLVLYVAEVIIAELLSGQLFTFIIVTSIVSMIVLMINGRAVGTIYREREEELEWL